MQIGKIIGTGLLCLALAACSDDNPQSVVKAASTFVPPAAVVESQKPVVPSDGPSTFTQTAETDVTVAQPTAPVDVVSPPEVEPAPVLPIAPPEVAVIDPPTLTPEPEEEPQAEGDDAVVTLASLRPTFQSFEKLNGSFQLTEETSVVVDDDIGDFVHYIDSEMGVLSKIRFSTGLPLKIVPASEAKDGDIILTKATSEALLKAAEDARVTWGTESRAIKTEVLNEGYSYEASAKRLVLTYAKEDGAIRSLQSLYQLVANDGNLPGAHRILPLGKGLDYPKFGYRGIMLDVARQFVSMPELMGLMDKMAFYKLNVLRLHLNDNVGDGKALDFRGNENAPQGGPNGYFRLYDDSQSEKFKVLKPKDSPSDGEDRTYYTKNDIQILIVYGRMLGIEIIPEFDSPGHSYVFTNAFPQWASAENASVIDVKNAEAVAYVKDAIVEFASWFTSKKIHIGGDEAYGTPNRDLLVYLEDLRKHLVANNIGTEFIGAWNDWGLKSGPSDKFVIYNWADATKAQLSGRKHIDVAVSRYFVPFKEKGDYNSLGLTSQRVFDTVKGAWDLSGLPIGGETAVWNDFGEAYDYGFEAINAGIIKSLAGLGYAYWNGLPLGSDNKVLKYSDLPSENILASREYTSYFVKAMKADVSAIDAVVLLSYSSANRYFTLPEGPNAVPVLQQGVDDGTNPIGWDPLDMKALAELIVASEADQDPEDSSVMHLQ